MPILPNLMHMSPEALAAMPQWARITIITMQFATGLVMLTAACILWWKNRR